MNFSSAPITEDDSSSSSSSRLCSLHIYVHLLPRRFCLRRVRAEDLAPFNAKRRSGVVLELAVGAV